MANQHQRQPKRIILLMKKNELVNQLSPKNYWGVKNLGPNIGTGLESD